jgi:hypothetical protein
MKICDICAVNYPDVVSLKQDWCVYDVHTSLCVMINAHKHSTKKCYKYLLQLIVHVHSLHVHRRITIATRMHHVVGLLLIHTYPCVCVYVCMYVCMYVCSLGFRGKPRIYYSLAGLLYCPICSSNFGH